MLELLQLVTRATAASLTMAIITASATTLLLLTCCYCYCHCNCSCHCHCYCYCVKFTGYVILQLLTINLFSIVKEITTENSWRPQESRWSRRSMFHCNPKSLLLVLIRVTCTKHFGLNHLTMRYCSTMSSERDERIDNNNYYHLWCMALIVTHHFAFCWIPSDIIINSVVLQWTSIH